MGNGGNIRQYNCRYVQTVTELRRTLYSVCATVSHGSRRGFSFKPSINPVCTEYLPQVMSVYDNVPYCR
jgi:hypothetical protein